MKAVLATLQRARIIAHVRPGRYVAMTNLARGEWVSARGGAILVSGEFIEPGPPDAAITAELRCAS
jgi:hypothetical protein